MNDSRRSSGPRILPLLGIATAIMIVLALPASAGQAAGGASQDSAPSLIAVVGEECPANDEAPLAGIKAFIDPRTGQLRAPTREEEQELARSGPGMRLKGAPVFKAVQSANGMISLVLGEEFMNDVVVRQAADGSLAYVCTPAPLAGKALTERPAAELEER